MFYSLKLFRVGSNWPFKTSFKTRLHFFIRIWYVRVKPSDLLFLVQQLQLHFYLPVFLSVVLHWLATLLSSRIVDQYSLLYGKSALSEERLVHKIVYHFISVPLHFSFSLVSFVFVFLFLFTRAARQCIMPHHGVSPVHTQGANMAPQDGFNTSFLCVFGCSIAF